ncbi:hypothetical protein D3C80_1518890 [compost metagenome]
MAWKWQPTEHQDGLHHMVIDQVALLFGQGAAADTEVIQLAAVELVLRHIEFETPGIVIGNLFAGRALEQVLGLVCQQWLERWQWWGRRA